MRSQSARGTGQQSGGPMAAIEFPAIVGLGAKTVRREAVGAGRTDLSSARAPLVPGASAR